MGFRSRIKDRLRTAIRGTSPSEGARPGTAPSPPPARAAPPPTPPDRPAPAPDPRAKAASAGPAPAPADPPAPRAAPELDAPTAEPTPSPSPAPEPRVNAAPEPEPNAKGDHASAAPAPAPASDGAARVAQLFASDYETTDAPVRNAHYADVFESTERAMEVRVYAPSEGLDVRFPVEPGEYVLDAAERAGLELPYSCRSGGCLSCSARLDEGETEMEEQYVLEDEHVQHGYRLLCLTTVRSPCTFQSHMQDEIE